MALNIFSCVNLACASVKEAVRRYGGYVLRMVYTSNILSHLDLHKRILTGPAVNITVNKITAWRVRYHFSPT